MEDKGRRASKRARRPPPRLDNGGDEHSVQQALRKSLIDQKRIINTIPDAPVFHPTVEEFSNVLEYIASIKKAGEAAGIVKIVPPPGWKPTFELRSDNQTFPTKRQLLHKLQEGLPFDEGEEYTQQTYCQKANAFKQQWLQSHPEINAALQAAIQDEGSPGDNGNAAAKILEEQYWRIVERASQEEVTVDYANDLDTKRYGTGFSEPATAIRPWDLNNLYQQPHSLLAMLDEVVEGVSYPWLYFGMLFSTFCWHNEDHFLYSINYMHEGEGKTWYGVPGTSARRFEEVMRTTAPQRFEQDRDLLHHLTTLTPPTLLMNNGVKVVHTVQHEGEFIVTFPKAYHSGFSLGWNAAEAANFAVMDWLPYGFEAVESYAKGPSRRPAVFSHDKLVWRCCEEVVAALNSDSKQTNGPANATTKQVDSKQAKLEADEQAVQKEIKRLTGRSASSSVSEPVTGFTHQHQVAAQQPSQRDLALLALGLKPAASFQPALKTVSVHVNAHAGKQTSGLASVAHQIGLKQAELSVLSRELERLVTPELKMRAALRTAGIREAVVSEAAMTPADGDLPSCQWCGHASFLSYVKCSCRPSQMRCLGHAHHGCVCYWPSKILYTHVPDAQLLAMKGLLQSLVKQSSGSTPSDTLMTAMSRLASEHKADRATKDNPHRKRKSAEAFPANNGVGIAKLNPNSKTLPPLSMGQQNKSASAGPSAHQQPAFQGSLVSAAQAHNVMHRQHSGSQPPMGQLQEARKRVKLEQSSAAVSRQTSGSKQASGSKHTAASRQRSGSRQSSDDGQTNTEGVSQLVGSHQSSQQATNHDTVTSAPAPQQPASAPGSSFAQHAQHTPQEQQVTFPFRLVMPRAAQPAAGVSSSVLNGHRAAFQLPAEQPAVAQQVPQQPQSQPEALSAARQDGGVPAEGENCMAALAEAAAAASEGSAASSSSLANSDDDQDAAAILRDLQNSAGPAPQTSPSEGTGQPSKVSPDSSAPDKKRSKGGSVKLPSLTRSRPSCVACGRSGKALLQCMSCDCFYHMRCAAPETRRQMAPGDPWLCENCLSRQQGF